MGVYASHAGQEARGEIWYMRAEEENVVFAASRERAKDLQVKVEFLEGRNANAAKPIIRQ
jgi:hypothetical protein